MTLLQHHILALSLTAITTFGLGLLVFLAESKRRLNQIFGLYSLAITGWAVGEILTFTAPDQFTANLWAYVISWPSVIFIAPTFLHSVFLSIDEKGKTASPILRIAYVLSLVFVGLHFFLPGALTRPPKPSSGYEYFHQDLSVLGAIIPLTFLVLVNLALWKLWRSYRQTMGQQRTQLKYLFWASVIGYVGGSPDWCLVYGIHLPFVNPFGLYGVPCYSIATTYAVLHHRLFNVHLVIRKSLVYSILVTVLTVCYFGLVYAVERMFQLTFGYQSVWVSLGAFAMMALAFQPLKIGIQRLVDWLLFRTTQEELVKRMERLEQEARQTEQLRAVATLAAGMAHEIRNPLSSLKTFAEYLPKKYDDPEFREKFSRIMGQEIGKVNELVQRLLDFAKPQPPQQQRVRVSRIVDETVEFLHGALVGKHIEVVRGYSTQDAIWADPTQLKQAFLNVLLNSIQAMERPGCITVSTVCEDGHLDILVADTGPGIAKERLPRVFDPFYTTKPGGTGLGLSVVHSIVKEHGGRVLIDSREGGGTTVRMQFPTDGGQG